MITLISSFVIRHDKKDAFIRDASELIEKSRRETDNIRYDLCQDTAKEDQMVFIETWQNEEAIKEHEVSEHVISITPKLTGFIENKEASAIYKIVNDKRSSLPLFKRRSIRSFKEKSVEQEKINRILEAGMCAPSGGGKAPWEFIVVTNEEVRTAISKMSPHAKMAAKAPILIITLAIPDISLKGNRWPLDLSACTQNMLIQIADEGLGGVWLGFYPEEERMENLREYFNLPKNIVPFSVIAFGYGNKSNEYIKKYDEKKVHYEKY